MFITCNQSDLIKTLNIVIRAVPSRSTIDILSCVVIKTIGDTINLVANDIDFGIESVLSGTVNEGGSIALGAKIFTDIVRKLPNDTVTIKTDDTLRATITCGKSVFKIAGRGTDDYPDLPEVKEDKKITISQFSLKDVINKTIFAASTNETVKILTGEYFEVSDNRLRVTALDNHRIAVHSIDLVDNNDNVKAIIPAKTLNEVSRIISGEVSENIDIYFDQRFLVFEFDDTVITSRLIEGDYIDIHKMISDDYETKVHLNRISLLEQLDSASPLITESEKKPIIFDITDKNMNLSANTSIGSLNSDMDIEKEGRDIMIGFNPHFLMDAVKAIDDETIDLYFTNQKAPCFIKDEDNSYKYVVLPVNFSTSDVE